MNILVPTDITTISLNALQYSLKRFPGANHTVLHVISGITNVKYPYHLQTGLNYDKAIEQELEELLLHHFQMDQLPKNVSVKVVYGEPVKSIVDFAETINADAIVVGNRDNHDQIDKLFGTISLGVIKTSSIPVFAIPKFGKYKGDRKILVGSNSKIDDEDVFTQIDYWNSSNAQVNFVHVKDEASNLEFTRTKEAIIDHIHEGKRPMFTYTIEQIESKKIGSGLLSKAYNDKVDLLVVVSSKSNLIESLLIKSTSKDILLKAKIPVLFLH